MRILAFGTYDAHAHPRVAVLVDGLRAHGHDVVECNVPLGLDTSARVGMLRAPWRVVGLAARLLGQWATLLRRARRLPRPDAVLVGYLGHFDVLLARATVARRRLLVLDHLVGAADTARDRGAGGGVLQRALRALDRAATGAADVVVVDTDEHVATLPVPARRKAVVVAVGAPAAWFAARREPEPGRLRVVFFASFTPLQGAVVVAAATQGLDPAELTLTLVGTGQDAQAARAAAGPAARWVGWTDAAALPELVAGHHVCLGIFGTTPKARRVVPNKVFQGAAAGCAVVTSDTPPQRRLLGDSALLVPAGDADALRGELLSLARDPARVAALRAAAARLADAGFGANAVTAPLAARLATAAVRDGRGSVA